MQGNLRSYSYKNPCSKKIQEKLLLVCLVGNLVEDSEFAHLAKSYSFKYMSNL